MLSYIIRRLLSILPVMLIAAIIIFVLLHLAPGDPAAVMAGNSATPQTIAEMRNKMGLDEPLWWQFGVWALNLLQGDLGQSILWGTPVTTLLAQRIEPTLSLTITTTFFAVSLALLLGIAAAAKAGTAFDRLVMAFAVLDFSIPVFVVGYGLIYIFAIKLKWLPVQGYSSIADGLGPWLRSLALPTLTLGLIFIALISRITRSTLLEVLDEDFMRTARAKGVAGGPLLLKHALKNAALPIVTVIGMGLGFLIGGAVITETVYNIPGIGRLLVDAISQRDYPVIQGVTLVFSAVYMLVNLVVDLSYPLFDPRIRY
ncbi:ABC transporter permease [Bradyrhizobium canariense]|uniref:ABC transporter permease n=1 Tax=Bradyrhizobium canariense TaxID=255045 RepID=UPI000A18D7A9|nr:ABC transporter permease [Bradyrhizobium canariense]OSI30550.1 peptide ABC transporter [Bradyrhizobium canariense]OSI37311.1 peptide ABC transporter [Bradyrhizobium canariense]OSI52031.1 peptide ABC transporter [Bradyrhizobium canariense]OSI56334.1 peptide ABC transporter [Bradyrhizobium canariense]OSI59406.1 peptide ABC transporter [Bradyrhizobium canariense]